MSCMTFSSCMCVHVFFGSIVFTAIHQALHLCSVKFSGRLQVFVNMLSKETCVVVILGISCFNFTCKVYSVLYIQKQFNTRRR